MVKAHEGRSYAVITDIGTFKLSEEDTNGTYLFMSSKCTPHNQTARQRRRRATLALPLLRCPRSRGLPHIELLNLPLGPSLISENNMH